MLITRRFLRLSQFALSRVCFAPSRSSLPSSSHFLSTSISSTPLSSFSSSPSTSSSETYSKLLDDLLTINMNRMVKMGITNTLRLISAMENTTDASTNGEGKEEREEKRTGGWAGETFRTVHVAGTNGKGSVTVKIASVLQAHGFKVGVFTSPHISSFRERIVVNGEYITEEAICEILPQLLKKTREHNIEATFFELTTLLGLRYFALRNVDFAVIEVGMGGRLDSTNVILPEISVITSISLDHVSSLGDTIEKIAYEKCGIIKPGVPVVIGPRTPASVSLPIAKKLGSKHIQVCAGEVFEDFDEENTKIAECAIEELWKTMDGEVYLDREKMSQALKARPPCRFQHFQYVCGSSGNSSSSGNVSSNSPTSAPQQQEQLSSSLSFSSSSSSSSSSTIDVVLDVGHNEDGLKHLFARFKKKFPDRKARVVFGLAKEKDAGAVMKLFPSFEQIKAVHLVQAQSPRAALIEDISRLASEHFGSRIIIEKSTDASVSAGIQAAIKDTLESKREEVLVVCGSFFVMKEARAAFGIAQPLDPVDLNERFSPTPGGKAIGSDTGPMVFNI